MKLVPVDKQLMSAPAVADSEFLSGLCSATLALFPNREPPLPWSGYLVEENGAYIGTCAFKSVPVQGKVEIAYFTFPGHEGRGVATWMAQQLIELAQRPEVTQISAQTLQERNASVRILEKLGFRITGTAIDPDAGEVWEWHLL
jgi:[ribosomal protein S5]-alanine N-acetyltransferase